MNKSIGYSLKVPGSHYGKGKIFPHTTDQGQVCAWTEACSAVGQEARRGGHGRPAMGSAEPAVRQHCS